MWLESLELPPTNDFHVHLRDGKLMELVVPTIRQGGCDTVYVMPNLTPPITTVAAALAYRGHLQALAPDVTFLITLYLHPSVTPAVVAEAAAAGIAGIKAYPRGLTTNSAAGVAAWDDYWPVFEAMQAHDLVLNLHGEAPHTPASDFAACCGDNGGSDPAGDAPTEGPAVTVLGAEAAFLPTLRRLHAAFPRLRIVLEHATTAAALAAVRACGPTVAATVTAHHLWLTVDDWCGDAGNYCKPVAKTPADRVALVRAVVERDGKVFFGSDSAPHATAAKTALPAAAGVFTQQYATQLVVGAVEEGIRHGWVRDDVSEADLREFLRDRGRRFYKLKEGPRETKERKIVLQKREETIDSTLRDHNGSLELMLFRAGKPAWSLDWK